MPRPHRLRLPILLVLSLATFVPFVGRGDMISSHEARVALVARQMAESGWPWNARDVEVPRPRLVETSEGERLTASAEGETLRVNPWIVPVIVGEVRLQKPPLAYWCEAIVFRIFGFSDWAARIVPALLGALAVLLVWVLARHFIGRIGAWYAGLVWVSTYFVVDEFRKSMADPYLAFFVLAACCLWLRGRIIPFYAAIALGILAKGPVMLLFAVLFAVMCSATRIGARPAGTRWLKHGAGVLVFAVIVLPWPLAVVNSVPDAIELWRYESVGSFDDKVENARPWWYYLPNLLYVSLPWTPVWVLGVIAAVRWRSRHSRAGGNPAGANGTEMRTGSPLSEGESPRRPARGRRRVLPIVFTLAIVLFLSFSHAKKNAYLLPTMPLQAIIVAQGLLWMRAGARSRGRRHYVFIPALAFAAGIQVMLSGVSASRDNARSPRRAIEFALEQVEQSADRSLLVSNLPLAAHIYLPLEMKGATESNEVYVIVDDEEGERWLRRLERIPAGPVETITERTVPDNPAPDWKMYVMKIAAQDRVD